MLATYPPLLATVHTSAPLLILLVQNTFLSPPLEDLLIWGSVESLLVFQILLSRSLQVELIIPFSTLLYHFGQTPSITFLL